MTTARQWLCKVLRCQAPYADSGGPIAPPEVREASHRLNNEVMALRGHINNMTRAADSLDALVQHMKGKQS